MKKIILTLGLLLIASSALASTYTLTYIAGSNGRLSGATTQIVNEGDNGTPIVAVANQNFKFDKWSDGLLTSSRTDANVSSDISVTANFKALGSGGAKWLFFAGKLNTSIYNGMQR